MKNKTKNKLARNTVRVRKKKRAQEGEKTKKKPNKRLLVRVGSIVACMLLVCALVVPCFADPVVNLNAPLKAYDYFKTQYLFNDANNWATRTVMDYWYDNNTSSYGNIGIFRAEELVAGTIDGDTQTRFYLPEGIEYDYRVSIDFLFDIDGAFSAYLADSSGVTQRSINFYGESLDATLALYVPDYDNINLYVEFYDNFDYSLFVYYTCYYDDGEFICSPNEVIFTNRGIEEWRYSFSTGVQLRVAYTPVLYDPVIEGSTPFVSFVADVLGLTMYHPHDYWVGWSNSDSYFGGSQVYQDGFDEGYGIGYGIGYTDGIEYVDGDAFQAGYDKAVSEIESGDFGKNFLGNAFSAPFEGLKQIKLVEWTTADGEYISISVMTVFYATIGIALFIWFLKMFAGG